MTTSVGLGGIRMFVILLLALQAVSVLFSWLLNPLGQGSQTSFALLLAVNLVAFSMISYVNRAERVNRKLLLAGCSAALAIMLLLVVK